MNTMIKTQAILNPWYHNDIYIYICIALLYRGSTISTTHYSRDHYSDILTPRVRVRVTIGASPPVATWRWHCP